MLSRKIALSQSKLALSKALQAKKLISQAKQKKK